MSDLTGWGLSYRVWNALRNDGVHTSDDLLQLGRQGLMRTVNIGKVAVAEIVQAAKEEGIDIPFEGRGDTLAERLTKLEERVAKLEGSR